MNQTKTFFKNLIPFKLKRRIKDNLGVPSLHNSLLNLKRLGFNPNIILDIGAYEGYWTKEVLEIYPKSKFLMIEAQQEKEPYLNKVSINHPNVGWNISLLSSKEGMEKMFLVNETGSQVVQTIYKGDRTELLRTKTLDQLLRKLDFPLPDFLKLDVQGHELEILKGGEASLRNASICLLEVSLLNLDGNTPLFEEIVSFMAKRNFQVYDISQLMRRPLDKALFQLDIFFVNKDSELISNKSWN